MTQRTKFKIAVYGLLFVIACICLWWFNSIIVAKARDYERLADLKIIQGELTAYYYKFNTYKIPACADNTILNSCISQGQINFSQISDPLSSGIYQYVIYSLSDTDYQIGFALETKMGGLNAGGHIYGKNGVVN